MNQADITKHFMFDKKYWLLRHFLFWSFIYLDEVLAYMGIRQGDDYHLMTIITLALDFFLVYFNIYFLLPRFLKKGKYLMYFTLTVLQILFVVLSNIMIFDYLYPPSPEELEDVDHLSGFIYQSFMEVGVIFPAVAIKLIKVNWQDNERLLQLSELEHQTELAKLKKQINPHFLFNSLNAIYVQSKQNSGTVPESIMALSDLMRYQTYDAVNDKVALTKELEFIMNYLEMEKMRRENFDYDLSFNTSINNVKIEPLLILPLVENACKFSQHISSNDKSFVYLSFDYSDEKLMLRIENNKGSANKLKESAYSGEGIKNVTRRLELLYPNKHSIVFQKDLDNKFIVDLSFQTQ